MPNAAPHFYTVLYNNHTCAFRNSYDRNSYGGYGHRGFFFNATSHTLRSGIPMTNSGVKLKPLLLCVLLPMSLTACAGPLSRGGWRCDKAGDQEL